nr:cytochrome b-c1 complex subunit 9 [Biomphalaria glabrata]
MSFSNVSKTVYNAIFKRTSTFVLAAVILAYPFERAFNSITESYFRQINKGKLWEDLKAAREAAAASGSEEE